MALVGFDYLAGLILARQPPAQEGGRFRPGGQSSGNVGREELMSRENDEKAQKIHNPQAEFDKPSDVVKDSELSLTEKKKALENLEQDAHQLMTASNEGMAPENDHVAEHEPKLDAVVKAQQRIGEKPQHKPTQ
jgi:hypothetical protein